MTFDFRPAGQPVTLFGLRPENAHDTGTAILIGRPDTLLPAAAPAAVLARQIAEALETTDPTFVRELTDLIVEERMENPGIISIDRGHDLAIRAVIHGNHHLVGWTGRQHGDPIVMLRNADTGNPSIEQTLRKHGYLVHTPRGTRNCIVERSQHESPQQFFDTLLRIAHKRVPTGLVEPFTEDTSMHEDDHYPAGMPT